MVDTGIWIKCEQCKHKLFLIYPHSNINMEIKCHSCKTINKIIVDTDTIKDTEYVVESK